MKTCVRLAAACLAVVGGVMPAAGHATDIDNSMNGASDRDSSVSVRARNCAGEPMRHVVKRYRYVQGLRPVPLRCGHFTNGQGWGYRKFRALGRWNPWFDGMIGSTLQSPHHVDPQGSARVYFTRWFVECTPDYRFKVVVETRHLPGGGRHGVMTAYKDFR